MSAGSWDEVTPTTLENCLKRAGFLIQEDEDNDFGGIDDVKTSAMREVRDTVGVEGVSLDDYITADENVVATEFQLMMT